VFNGVLRIEHALNSGIVQIFYAFEEVALVDSKKINCSYYFMDTSPLDPFMQTQK
jgi:hypothetical protein